MTLNLEDRNELIKYRIQPILIWKINNLSECSYAYTWIDQNFEKF